MIAENVDKVFITSSIRFGGITFPRIDNRSEWAPVSIRNQLRQTGVACSDGGGTTAQTAVWFHSTVPLSY